METIKKTPLISVIIPLYNKEKVVLKTLQSIVQQSYNDFEVVIVNDGSTDQSVKIISDFLINNNNLSHVSNIRLIHKSNGGVASARNRGIEDAKGQYIAFLDADDEWMPDFLTYINELIVKYPIWMFLVHCMPIENLLNFTKQR